MPKQLNKDDFEDILNEAEYEIDEALKTPETARKYFDELDDFITNISEDELTDELDAMLYHMVEKMLEWSDEKIESHLSNVPISIIKEYLKCIRTNEKLQNGNSSKINILKNLVKKQCVDKNKIPHDINQVNLCGWVSKNSTNFKKNEIHFGCKFSIALHWNGRYDEEGKPYVSFIDIEYRGKNAVLISPYLVKGKRVAISGKLVQHRWEQDGIKNSHIVVLANDVIIFNDERKFELVLE
jgi:hypothetical protein